MVKVKSTILDTGKGKVSFFRPGASSVIPGVTRPSATSRYTVNKVGDLNQYFTLYANNKLVQSMIHFIASYVALKDDWYIQTDDEELAEEITNFYEDMNLSEILYVWCKFSLIYGISYLEITGNNLVFRDSRFIFPQIDAEGTGEVQAYVQAIPGDPKPVEWKPTEMAQLRHAPLDHLRGLSLIEGLNDIIDLDDSVMWDLAAQINNGAYQSRHWTVGNEENPVSTKSPIFTETKEQIEAKKPGEDIITSAGVKSTPLDAKGQSMEYKTYVETIFNRFMLSLGIPPQIFGGNVNQTSIPAYKNLFESSVIIPLRKSISHAMRTSIIPNHFNIPKESRVRFAWKAVDSQQAFIEEKTHLIQQTTGAETPEERRQELGKPPLSTEESAQPNNASIPVESRGPAAEKSVGGNLTGQRKPNAASTS